MNKKPETYIEDLEELKKYRELGTVEEVSKRVNEEDILKFYYFESGDKYLVGKRIGTMYYAEITNKFDLSFFMSRYLPWGKHVVDESTSWKEHTYPSEPKEISFSEWISGYVNKLKEESKNNDWIPVSERLPNKADEVLCCNEDGVIVAGFIHKRTNYYVCENLPFVTEDIIAWQPLPERYEVED